MFFSKKTTQQYDFSFIDEKIKKVKETTIFISDEELKILNSENPIEKIKVLFEIEERELNYWQTFKNTYPVAMFCTTPQRRFTEWNKDFEILTGWSHDELKNIDSAAKVLWPINPSECRVCKIVGKFDMKEKRAGYGLAEIINRQNEHIPVFVYVIPVYKNGELDRTYVIVRDRREEINQRKAYLEEAINPIIQRLEQLAQKEIRELITIENDECDLCI